MNLTDLVCPNCNLDFDQNKRKPLIFPSCGHTFCSECIISLLKNTIHPKCPHESSKCKKSSQKHDLSQFPQNEYLLDIIRSNSNELTKKPNPNTYCKIHEKSFDLVCLTDKKYICHDCVLWGEHKNHEYTQIDNFQNLVYQKIEKVFFKIEKMKKITNYETKNDFTKLIFQKIEEKKSEIIKKNNSTVQKMLNLLNKAEMNSRIEVFERFDKIHQNVELILEKFSSFDKTKSEICHEFNKAESLTSDFESNIVKISQYFLNEKGIGEKTENFINNFENFLTSSNLEINHKISETDICIDFKSILDGIEGILHRMKSQKLRKTFAIEKNDKILEKSIQSKKQSVSSIDKSSKEKNCADLMSKRSNKSACFQIDNPLKTISSSRNSTYLFKTKNLKSQKEENTNNLSAFMAKNSQKSDRQSQKVNFEIFNKKSSKIESNVKNEKFLNNFSENEPKRKKSNFLNQKTEFFKTDSNINYFDKILQNATKKTTDKINPIDDSLKKTLVQEIKKNGSLKPSKTEFNNNNNTLHNGIDNNLLNLNSNSIEKEFCKIKSILPFQDIKKASIRLFASKPIKINVQTSDFSNKINPIEKNSQKPTIIEKNDESRFNSHFKTLSEKNDKNDKNYYLLNTFDTSKKDQKQHHFGSLSTRINNPSNQQTIYENDLRKKVAMAQNLNEKNKSICEDNVSIESNQQYIKTTNLFRLKSNSMRQSERLIPTSSSLGPKSKKLTNDLEINLSKRTITNSKLHQIIGNVMENSTAKILNLSKNFINEKGVELILQSLQNHPSIEILNLSGNILDDSIFEVILSFARKLKKIRLILLKDIKTFENILHFKKQLNDIGKGSLQIEM